MRMCRATAHNTKTLSQSKRQWGIKQIQFLKNYLEKRGALSLRRRRGVNETQLINKVVVGEIKNGNCVISRDYRVHGRSLSPAPPIKS